MAVVTAAATLLANGRGVSSDDLKLNWQLIDLRVLADDPIRSIWYLHTQPPGYNVLVGAIAWLGPPLAGTTFVVYMASLLGVGLLLQALLMRWGLGPLGAGGIAAVAVLNPNLLATVPIASYETVVALQVIAALYSVQRYLDTRAPRWLLAASALVTAGAMTRSLLNPLWVFGLLALVLVARPVRWRVAAAALAIPLVAIGGWMLKNQVLFDVPTTSSWLGFNMQRGVVAPMNRDHARADLAEGAISPLATKTPWLMLDSGYPDWYAHCRPAHDHPATSWLRKQPFRTMPVPNFNHECYLPLYHQAQADAFTLMRRHPASYLGDRGPALAMSYRISEIGLPEHDTWLDNVYESVMVRVVVEIDSSDWNVPLLSTGKFPITVSLTLVALSVFVLWRGGLAAWRLARAGWRDRAAWPAREVVWLLVTWTGLVVIAGGDLIEFGENTRFRSTLDPLFIALPLAAAVQAIGGWRSRRASAPTADAKDTDRDADTHASDTDSDPTAAVAPGPALDPRPS
jgi:hypothetical protein